MKRSTAAVSLVMVTGMCGLGTGPATADTAVSAEPTVVRLLGGGVMQVATPDETSNVDVTDESGAFSVTEIHPLVAVAPCEVDHQATFDRVLCPADQVSSVLVLTSTGADEVRTRVAVPVFVSTGAGNDFAVDHDSPDAHFVMGPGADSVVPGFGGNDVLGGRGEDAVSYGFQVDPVVVRLDGVANDGVAPMDDNIHSDVEDIFGGLGDDLLAGSDDANVIDGRQGDDLVFGLAGDDTFPATVVNGPSGADEVFGGAGTDTVSYADRPAGVIVRIDDLGFDGQPGENDNVHSDVENIVGGFGDDVLTGSSASNRISGRLGNDLLDGGVGGDVIEGGGGTDSVTYTGRTVPVTVRLDGVANDGQSGERDNVLQAENLVGGNGNDTLIGNAGPNLLRGLLGNDRLLGRAGNDVLIGSEGSDLGDGGAGVDLCRTETRVHCP